eukprot:Lankesteria_metandrocarpae@DN3801_c0_g1_i1.p1
MAKKRRNSGRSKHNRCRSFSDFLGHFLATLLLIRIRTRNCMPLIFFCQEHIVGVSLSRTDVHVLCWAMVQCKAIVCSFTLRLRNIHKYCMQNTARLGCGRYGH